MTKMLENVEAGTPPDATDEIIAALQQECAELRSALCQVKHTAAKIQAENAAAKKRAAYDRHMGWHHAFNPHDTKNMRIQVDEDLGQQVTVPYSVFESSFARRVFRKLERKLQKLSPPNDIATRRELIAAAYKKILTTYTPSFWLRMLSRLF